MMNCSVALATVSAWLSNIGCFLYIEVLAAV